ncbi:MAG TPA: RNA pseudouridine synthase, partial [Chitinophagaceae bacterium]|nr:RNA pseudouridine synthase [Chitinophagaceae bacterium]
MLDELDVSPEDGAEELYERQSFKVDKGQEPMRIDKWVQGRIEGATRSKVQKGIEAGFLTVNGQVVKS